jgi:hypothetical protein
VSKVAYPLSPGLRKSIGVLFADPSVAYGLLGHELDSRCSEVGAAAEGSALRYPDRLRSLCTKLEGYVAQLAEEAGEMDHQELPRLRGEAVGVLVALRELQRHFPEELGGR